jgi:hypothetical protein
MKTLLGLFMGTLMLGGVLYQLVSGKLLGRDWRPYTTRDERPVMYWTAIAIEAAGALWVLYGVLHDAHR